VYKRDGTDTPRKGVSVASLWPGAGLREETEAQNDSLSQLCAPLSLLLTKTVFNYQLDKKRKTRKI